MANVKSELIKKCRVDNEVIEIQNPFISCNPNFQYFDNNYNVWYQKVQLIQQQLNNENKTTKIEATNVGNDYRVYLLYDYQFIENTNTTKEKVMEEKDHEKKKENEELEEAKQLLSTKNKQYVSSAITEKQSITDQLNNSSKLIVNLFQVIIDNNIELSKDLQEKRDNLIAFEKFKTDLIAKKNDLKTKIKSATSIKELEDLDLEKIEQLESVEEIKSVESVENI